MTIRRHIVTAVTASDGSATAYSRNVSGKLTGIHYIKTDYTNGVGFTITAEATGETLWTEAAVNASKYTEPRGATHSTAGVASLYAAGGVAVNDYVRLGNDRVKIVIASGGAAHTGTFHIIMED